MAELHFCWPLVPLWLGEPSPIQFLQRSVRLLPLQMKMPLPRVKAQERRLPQLRSARLGDEHLQVDCLPSLLGFQFLKGQVPGLCIKDREDICKL